MFTRRYIIEDHVRNHHASTLYNNSVSSRINFRIKRKIIRLFPLRSYFPSLSSEIFLFLISETILHPICRGSFTLKQFLVNLEWFLRGFEDSFGVRSFASGTFAIDSFKTRIDLLAWTFAHRAYLGRKSDRQLHMMDTLIIESGRGPRWINSIGWWVIDPPAKYPLSNLLINLYRLSRVSFYSPLKTFRDGTMYDPNIHRYEKCLSGSYNVCLFQNKRYIFIVLDRTIPSVQIKQYIYIYTHTKSPISSSLSLLFHLRAWNRKWETFAAIRIVFRSATSHRAIGRVTENIVLGWIPYRLQIAAIRRRSVVRRRFAKAIGSFPSPL